MSSTVSDDDDNAATGSSDSMVLSTVIMVSAAALIVMCCLFGVATLYLSKRQTKLLQEQNRQLSAAMQTKGGDTKTTPNGATNGATNGAEPVATYELPGNIEAAYSNDTEQEGTVVSAAAAVPRPTVTMNDRISMASLSPEQLMAVQSLSAQTSMSGYRA